jgi:hypothetical protein
VPSGLTAAIEAAGAEALSVSRRATASIANGAGDCGGVAGAVGASVTVVDAESTAATRACTGGSACAGCDFTAVTGALAALVSLDAVVPRLVWAVTDVGGCGLSAFDSAEVVSVSLASASFVPTFFVPTSLVPASDADGGEVDGEPFVAPESADASEGPASDDESDPVVSAAAIPGLFATAAPIPRATANPPTRPMNLAEDEACRRRCRATGRGVHESSRGIDIEAHLPGRT